MNSPVIDKEETILVEKQKSPQKAKTPLKNTDERIEWVDSLKFIGIFLIYLAHFVDTSGKLCLFAYAFHVPLFFFISGFFSLKHKEDGILKYIISRAKTLLIPYTIFCVISAVIVLISTDAGIVTIGGVLKNCAIGLRNKMTITPLWFIPCLFVVSILFKCLLKLLKNKWIVLGSCLVIFFLAEAFFPADYVVLPRWIFSADAALYYLLFYAIGAVSFDFIKNIKKLSIVTKIAIGAFYAFTAAIAVIVYYQQQDMIHNCFKFLPFGKSISNVFIALCLIVFSILIAKLLARIKFFNEIGKNTLWLCGSEYIIKTIVPAGCALLGLSINMPTPLHTCIYSFVLLVIASYTLVPVEKKIYEEICNINEK